MVPTMTHRIELSLWDSNVLGKDDVAAFAYFSFGDVQAVQYEQMKRRGMKVPDLHGVTKAPKQRGWLLKMFLGDAANKVGNVLSEKVGIGPVRT